MEIYEMFKRMSTGEVQAHSELGTRDENMQVKKFATRIQRMKTCTGINARAMVMKDLVIPFNPFTGEPDEQYNKKTPFRPILLVSQTIEMIKMGCKENPAMREFWAKDLDIEFTDGPATMDEYLAFKKRGYVFPRIMSYATVAMNFHGIHGFPDFAAKYTVDPTELNDEFSYDYDKAPIWHQAAIFFYAMLRPEADERKKKLEMQGQSKDTVQAERRAVFSKSPVSQVKPTNLIPFLFFPLDELPPKLDATHPQELEKYMRFYSYTQKWTVPLKEAMEKPRFDEVIDFFDFTIKTPTSDQQKANGQVYTDEDVNELYQALTISTTDGRDALLGGYTEVKGQSYANSQLFAPVYEMARAYFLYSQEQSSLENGESFEKIMAASNRFRPITVALPNFLPACNQVFNEKFANTPYFTDAVKRANSQFFTAMNPANVFALASEDEEDLEEARQAQRQSAAELLRENADVSTDDAAVLGVNPNTDISDLTLA